MLNLFFINNYIKNKIVNNIGDEGAKSISEALKSNSSLEVLTLNSLIYFLIQF
jgi:hypothetical protein